MSKNYKDDIYSQIAGARKCNYCFDEFVKVCEKGIESWKYNLIAKNNFPRMLPKLPREPRYTLVSILLPVVPISPNETKLLLNYLNEKYLENDEKDIGGDYFTLRKCFFRNNYKLSSHFVHYEL